MLLSSVALTHRVRWLIDHVITSYANKSFIFTFARAHFFTIQGSILLIYKQKLKNGKVTSFFSKSTNLWKKFFIPRHNMIVFIYKSWSVNSGWLTLFVRSKATRGNSFAFKKLLTIFSLQEQSFYEVHSWFFFKKVKSSTLFCGQKCITITIEFTKREFVS